MPALSQRQDHISNPVGNALKPIAKLADFFTPCFQWRAPPNQIAHAVKKLMLLGSFVVIPLLSFDFSLSLLSPMFSWFAHLQFSL